MPNPRKESAHKAKPTGISLPPELAREARMDAYSNGMSLSKFVCQLLLRELNTMEHFRRAQATSAQSAFDLRTGAK